jgi:thioredoxin 2
MSDTNISCVKCTTTNRIPNDRLSDKPKCGKCKTVLFAGKPQVMTSANVATILNHNDIPVLVDCWAPWCGPCRSFAPIFEKAALALEPAIRLAKLDTQSQQSVASRWQIRSIPTLILFQQGKEKARVSGALSLSQLKQWVAQNAS